MKKKSNILYLFNVKNKYKFIKHMTFILIHTHKLLLFIKYILNVTKFKT